MKKYLIIENNFDNVNSIINVFDGLTNWVCIGIVSEYDITISLILKEAPELVFYNINSVFERPYILPNVILNHFNLCINFIALSSCRENAYDAIKNQFYDLLLLPLVNLDVTKSILKYQKENITTNRILII